MGSTELHLRWSSYESTLLTSVNDLWDVEAMTDVTLSTESGIFIRAHRVVLSSCSSYFREVLQNVAQTQHPIIVLPFTSHQDLLAVLRFMYRGEVNITQPELPGLLACAESLRVKGLAKINPLRACGLLQQAYQQDNNAPAVAKIKIEETAEMWNTYGEEEDAVEITEISEDGYEDPLITIDEDDVQDSADESNFGGEGQQQSDCEGNLYYIARMEQHDEDHPETDEITNNRVQQKNKKASNLKSTRRLYRALTAAWTKNSGVGGTSKAKERNSSASARPSSIRKTLLPVSCPVCCKVLSNAYNLKVHMSIHDGLNHQCSVCGHTSKSRDALRKHLAYRHLIGMSGPVRPRMPATKRRNNGLSVNGEDEEDGQEAHLMDPSGEGARPPDTSESCW